MTTEVSVLSEDDPEVRANVIQISIKEDDWSVFNKFSSWQHAIRVMYWCVKFKNKLLEKLGRHKTKGCEVDNVAELEYAKHIIIKQLQMQAFSTEMCQLLKNSTITRGSKLSSLDPFLDEHGLLRVGGRIQKSSFLYGVKHPLIIPKDTHITRLIINHHHEKIHHQGRGMTMNQLRSSGFWIIGCSKAVSSCIFKCVTCRRLRRRTEGQKMADSNQHRHSLIVVLIVLDHSLSKTVVKL